MGDAIDAANPPTAEGFIEQLTPLGSTDGVRAARRYLKPEPQDAGDLDIAIGARMGDVFALAKTSTDMLLSEVEVLLESPVHEARVGAVSIMDFQARRKRTSAGRRQELFEQGIRDPARITNTRCTAA